MTYVIVVIVGIVALCKNLLYTSVGVVCGGMTVIKCGDCLWDAVSLLDYREAPANDVICSIGNIVSAALFTERISTEVILWHFRPSETEPEVHVRFSSACRRCPALCACKRASFSGL